jgi:hypothetical protein
MIMNQFKVQAALSSMVTPNASSAGSTESEMMQQQQQQSQVKQEDVGLGKQDDVNNGGAMGPESDRLDVLLTQDFSKGGGDRGSQHHPVAEFLYQLTKMLTDDNSEIIEWVDGRIKVHYPERLEGEVLHKYFRHSKFASFQRQLNYFGFRKIAGKGKMSPCSYVNESATSDIRSLLLIKRKTNGSAARKAMAQRALSISGGMNPALGTGLPGLSGAGGMGGFGGPGGLAALNQLQMQKQAMSGMYGAENPLSQLLAQNQQRQSWNDLQQLGGLKPNMPSLEQLQAQLATLQNRQGQGQGGASAALNALNFASNNGMSQYGQGNENPATAALNAASSPMPATAAMNAGGSSNAQSNNLFESATNLKALLGNDPSDNNQQMAGAPGGPGRNNPSQNLLNRLPSAANMFQSNASLGNLLASSNRLSSLLSLNSFLSREPSLADLAMMPNGAQLAAYGVGQQNAQEMANRFNHSTA